MPKQSPFAIVVPTSTLAFVLEQSPTMSTLLRRLGFPDCRTCSVRFDETLAEAAINYQLDLELVLMTLNATLLKERIQRQQMLSIQPSSHNGVTT